jgi:hypothetical protein
VVGKREVQNGLRLAGSSMQVLSPPLHGRQVAGRGRP